MAQSGHTGGGRRFIVSLLMTDYNIADDRARQKDTIDDKK